jgi:hypothetical protein
MTKRGASPPSASALKRWMVAKAAKVKVTSPSATAMSERCPLMRSRTSLSSPITAVNALRLSGDAWRGVASLFTYPRRFLTPACVSPETVPNIRWFEPNWEGNG